jgi:hypothetical protein
VAAKRVPTNLCTTCGEDFGSLEAFDAHRVGTYPQRGPSEYEGDIEEWTPEKGRRCLTVEEMQSGSFRGRQFARNGRGRWSLEKRLNRTRESFSVQLPSPERHSKRSRRVRETAPRQRRSPARKGQGGTSIRIGGFLD